MTKLRFIPLVLILGFGALAWFGPKGNAFNGPQLVRCAYELAKLDAPPANVLFVGSSRFGRGFDHGYMRDRIRNEINKDIVIERIALTFPQITQFRPPLENYLKNRGAPDYVFLQVMYNFKPERQRRWDIPLNSVRNVSYASLDTLLDIRRNAGSTITALSCRDNLRTAISRCLRYCCKSWKPTFMPACALFH